MGFNAEDALSRYLALRRARPDLMINRPGGIEVLSEVEDIRAAQMAARSTRLARGDDIDDLRAGLLAHDPHMTMVRDPVRFPDGSLGLYNRIIERRSVAILPMLEDRVVLIRIFRHGLRDWLLEFPRGALDGGEGGASAARRELREEIGAEARELVPLGEFTPGASSMSIMSALFLARIEALGDPDRGEGIDRIEVLGVPKLEALIDSGGIIDGFTLSLFARARVRGLI